VSRANFLPTSLLPFTLGSALAGREGPFYWIRFLIGLASIAAVHLAANLFNEYWDHCLAADAHGKGFAPHFGGSQSIQTGLVSAGRVRAAALICLAAGLIGGLSLAAVRRSLAGLLFVIAGSFLAWAYTARPLSLAYRGLGEVALFAAFGLLLVNGGYLAQSGMVAAGPLLLSLSSGLLISSVLLVNEIADASSDRAAGKMNWAARFGPAAGARAIRIFVFLPYLIIIVGWAGGILPIGSPLALITLPFVFGTVRALRAAAAAGIGFEKSSSRMIFLYAVYHAAMIAIALIS
jgi:1,4-dihydroxy-2-naphthoate octaprenyltransferase